MFSYYYLKKEKKKKGQEYTSGRWWFNEVLLNFLKYPTGVTQRKNPIRNIYQTPKKKKKGESESQNWSKIWTLRQRKWRSTNNGRLEKIVGGDRSTSRECVPLFFLHEAKSSMLVNKRQFYYYFLNLCGLWLKKLGLLLQ